MLSTQIESIDMMGCQEISQAPLFYSFNLDAHIPANHLLRGIDRFLDLSELHQHLAPHYSNTGRPSIDPAMDGGLNRGCKELICCARSSAG